jgi:hypothetical protein
VADVEAIVTGRCNSANDEGEMTHVIVGLLAVLLVGWLAITTTIPKPPESQVCSAQWFHEVADRYFNPSDSEGHGPDLGSEWLSTVERKAKLPVREDLGNAERCERIQHLLQLRTFIINRALGLDISF